MVAEIPARFVASDVSDSRVDVRVVPTAQTVLFGLVKKIVGLFGFEA
jgi:hypothetical protein